MLKVKWQILGQFLNKANVSIFTDGKWGSENTPEQVAFDMKPEVAEHIVAIHNKSLS